MTMKDCFNNRSQDIDCWQGGKYLE